MSAHGRSEVLMPQRAARSSMMSTLGRSEVIMPQRVAQRLEP
jgi:hypothetical protein